MSFRTGLHKLFVARLVHLPLYTDQKIEFWTHCVFCIYQHKKTDAVLLFESETQQVQSLENLSKDSSPCFHSVTVVCVSSDASL